MKQAIAGVAPTGLGEVTVMVVWPSMASTEIGRALGQLFMIRLGLGNVLTVGNLIALLTIPITMHLYLIRLLPGIARRYRLTNQRVIVEGTYSGTEERSIGLGEFDAVELVVRPGQEWYPAGDLIFRRGKIEALRLEGVLRPETFRRTLLKSQRAFSGVERAVAQEAALA
jgi:hypothetical protein